MVQRKEREVNEFRILATIIFKLWIVEAHLNKVEYKEVEEANELEGRSLTGMRHQ